MFEIRLTPEAVEDLGSYGKRDRKRIMDQVEARLRDEPCRETRNNKVLRPNQVAERELRIDRFRVFFDVKDEIVKIVAVGHKSGNRLYIGGEEFKS